jgi:hypothetical protein
MMFAVVYWQTSAMPTTLLLTDAMGDGRTVVRLGCTARLVACL